MPALHRISRRLFLVELGKGALAVGVLGTAVAACGDDDDDDDDDDASVTSSTTEPDSTTSSSSTSTSGDGQAAAGEWRRVSLGFVSAYVLIRGKEAAVVDTGTEGSGPQIGAALEAGGSSFDAVRHVILTHRHPDHAGGLGDVLEAAATATAYAGEPDIGSIESARPLRAVADGDEVFGLRIIATPGHTAGHVCVLDPETSYLVAGDALTGQGDGGVGGANPQFTDDEDAAADSVRKLAELDFDTVVFGHGDPVETGGAAAVQALAADLS